MKSEQDKVIFFDGYCGLCNGFVDFIMKVDKKNIFYFSPLQSDFAKKNLPSEYTSDLKSIVVLINGQSFRKAKAVLAVFEQLGGLWWTLSLGKILPESLLNILYDLIASNRYRLFGKSDTCRLPTPAERQKFIL